MSCAPVVLLPFNRLEKVAEVIGALRVVKPEVLFIGADGPRAGNADDANRCAQVREYLDTAIDWPCDIRRHDWVENLGCNGNTELTLDRVFDEVDRAIVLDDDCVPDPTFFRFCTELLEKYADDERIVHIAGTNDDADPALFNGASYAFTTFGSNWGWATWSRAWKLHRTSFPRPHDHTTRLVAYSSNPVRYMPLADQRELTGGEFVRPAAQRFFRDVASGQHLSLGEWGQQWRLSMLNIGGLAITPAANLIENIGFDDGADSFSAMPTRPMPGSTSIAFPLRHPEAVELNRGVEDHLEAVLVRAVGRLARTIRARTPTVLRSAARRVGSVVVR